MLCVITFLFPLRKKYQMKYLKVLLTVMLLFSMMNAYSQAISENDWNFRCSTDSMYRDLVSKNPQVALNRAKLNDFVRQYISNNPKRSDDEVYVIPVVFHIVHEYGQENVSYEYIQNVVEQLNKDYRLMREDTAAIVADFKPIAADAKIEFRLARKDPDGNCTMGVTRTYSSTTKGGGEKAKMAAGTWDNSKYLNVWSVTSLSDGAAGWAYYPGTAPDDIDGVILMYDYLPRALTHEIGHCLNLAHPWGNSNDPGLVGNCDIDDGVDDTPNTIGHTSCNLNAVTCGSLDNVQNFMEYSYCYKMFTNGQAAVMRATLNSDASHRNNLWTEENRIATGTNDGYVEEECIPIADFNYSKKMICTGSTVSYNDYTYNTTSVDYRLWDFQGGDPATSEDENPTVMYNESGIFSTELYVENSVDGNSVTKSDIVRAYDKSDGYELPYVEHFETTTFPRISGNDGNDFYVENYNPNAQDGDDNWWNPGNESWTQVDGGVTGKALRIRNSRVSNSKNKIYMPNIRIYNDSTPLQISFKVAAAKKADDTYTDELYFYYSNSCGDTLKLGHAFSGTGLITAIVDKPKNYVPSHDEWKEHSFTVPASKLRGENFRLVIQSNNNFGNTIYIDDLSFSQVVTSVNESKNMNMSVYPNPFHDNMYIDIDAIDDPCGLEVYDIMGRLVYSGELTESHVNVGQALESNDSGVYFIKVYGKNACETIKVVKEK